MKTPSSVDPLHGRVALSLRGNGSRSLFHLIAHPFHFFSQDAERSGEREAPLSSLPSSRGLPDLKRAERTACGQMGKFGKLSKHRASARQITGFHRNHKTDIPRSQPFRLLGFLVWDIGRAKIWDTEHYALTFRHSLAKIGDEESGMCGGDIPCTIRKRPARGELLTNFLLICAAKSEPMRQTERKQSICMVGEQRSA